ncbi:TetR/AcrR family transcriptional regulator [Salibacterium salarium]|uniref:TetR/AcrR family transcriptional regulator n=1 Tax=Salibacterium salarium TaxID=284579 RepID=A0A3R9Q2W1_9BACI|nr:TetR/AcrR family transcriptional regulator [Salibacterium salarium]RSL32408.1 TetR/AcrR family transcriptional regulator [Salibacterium salarium]
MSDRKMEIMETAINLFSDKGYHFTSVQEITDACGISKGAFYKHFASKESMMLTLLQKHHDQLLQEADAYQVGHGLTPKERLIRKLKVELERSVEYRSFFNVLFTEFFPNEDGEVNAKMKQIQFALRSWHERSLLEAFGSRVKPYLGDLTTVMEGIIKEYLMLILWQRQQLSVQRLARFIVQQLDVMVQHDEEIRPVLPADFNHASNELEGKAAIQHELESMLVEVKMNAVDDGEAANAQKQQINTVEMLLKELPIDTPRDFLVEALMEYLCHFPSSREKSEKILALWKEWKGD